MITYLRQPSKNSCGQTCVAMITGLTVEEVCRRIGTRSLTYPSQTEGLLRELGYAIGETFTVGSAAMPELALIYIRYQRKRGGGYKTEGHVAVWYRGVIYDPIWGVQPDYDPSVVLKYYNEVTPPAPKLLDLYA